MESDYCDRTLIRLRREYTRDEVVSALYKKLSEKEIEIGQLKSEIDHLNSKLQNTKEQNETNKAGRIEARKDALYKLKAEENKKLKKQIKQLKQHRDELMSKLNNK
jgi:predicted  nucleic acid-binding Zn-ribbon protein